MAQKAVRDPAVVTVEKPKKLVDVRRDVDRVVMPSVRADGTPDQSDGFVVIEA